MDNPNLTMEEYVRLEEEKARKRGKVFDWQTATYGKIRVDDNFYDLRSMEAEFQPIVINDDFAPKDTLQCKSQVSIPVNDEIDYKISFDESDDEDYIIICDKNSFVNNLKIDSKNDYEKVMPSIPSPEPAMSCFDDLDFFKDFENEFPAIVYNDAKTSKSYLLTKPILNPQHIDEFDLSDKTSLSKYDKEEQNVLYVNDLFPFNIICSDDLKSEKDKDDNDIDITQSLLDNEITHGSTMIFETSHDKVTKTLRMESFVINLNVKVVIWMYYANGMLFYLIMNLCAPFGVPFDPKRYYKDGDCAIMLRRPRLNMAYPLTWIQHTTLPPCEQRHRFLRYEGLEYTDSDIADFESRLERIYTREIHRVQVVDFQGMLELLRDGLFAKMAMEHRDEASVVRDISIDEDFLGPPLSYTLIKDPVLRLCHRMMAHNISGRSRAPKKVTVTDLFYLRGLDIGSILRGFTVIAPVLQIIDMAELVRLQICMQLDDTWSWVAMGPERQPDVAAGAPGVAQDVPIIYEGGQAVPAPVHAP
ncbi:hypothetical protein Tco_0867676 [Tanacetum coccineum]